MFKHTHCCYCRRQFDDTNPNLHRTKDHFIPKSRTGNNGENLLDCCHECNQFKADREPGFWLNRLEYLLRKKTLVGTYKLIDYRQIIGSIRHWMKHFKGRKISDYKI